MSNDPGVSAAPKTVARGEVCTGPCDHDKHEQRGATWYGWYDRPCSSCGRPRAECRTPEDPFLSCCGECSRNDGDTHNPAAVTAARQAYLDAKADVERLVGIATEASYHLVNEAPNEDIRERLIEVREGLQAAFDLLRQT